MGRDIRKLCRGSSRFIFKFRMNLDAVDALEKAGVSVWKFHPEDGCGVHEMPLSPADSMTAVDNLVYAHDIIKSCAKKNGPHAMMMPQAIKDGPAIAQQMHISFKNEEYGDSFLTAISVAPQRCS